MLKNSKAKNSNDLRKFVITNIVLFEKAYLEFYKNKHRLHKSHNESNDFAKFVELARKEFKYSENTFKTDIWYRFIFKDIITGILKKHYPPKKKTTPVINEIDQLLNSIYKRYVPNI
jgi:hypothetical protein